MFIQIFSFYFFYVISLFCASFCLFSHTILFSFFLIDSLVSLNLHPIVRKLWKADFLNKRITVFSATSPLNTTCAYVIKNKMKNYLGITMKDYGSPLRAICRCENISLRFHLKSLSKRRLI